MDLTLHRVLDHVEFLLGRARAVVSGAESVKCVCAHVSHSFLTRCNIWFVWVGEGKGAGSETQGRVGMYGWA